MIRRGLRILWHRLRRHTVRDLGYPLDQHRVWCYDCAIDLLPWTGCQCAGCRDYPPPGPNQ